MSQVISQYATPFVAAIFIGLGCGFSCGSTSVPFLTTYIMGTQKGALNGFKSMIVFTTAKIVTLICLGVISSIIGKSIFAGGQISSNIFENICRVLMNVVIIIIGIVIFINSTKYKGSCSNCTCNSEKFERKYELKTFKSYIPLLVAGGAYAVTPCPPLIGMLACSMNMTPFKAAILLFIFGLSSSTSPLILFSMLAGHFSKRIRVEAPKYKMLFQRIASIILIFIGIYPMIPIK